MTHPPASPPPTLLDISLSIWVRPVLLGLTALAYGQRFGDLLGQLSEQAFQGERLPDLARPCPAVQNPPIL